MKEKELRTLSKKQLIKKLLSHNANYYQLRFHYYRLKADILIIKKQLENIANNIVYSQTSSKSSSRINYYKGGKLWKNKLM